MTFDEDFARRLAAQLEAEDPDPRFKRSRSLSRRELVAHSYEVLTAKRRAGYTLEGLTAQLEALGMPISVATLERYLRMAARTRSVERPDAGEKTPARSRRHTKATGSEASRQRRSSVWREERVQVPEALLEILQWHVETQLRTPAQLESDLLFPALHGGFRTRNVLDKPFRLVAAATGLSKRITPRGMRRTFQDLCRAAQVGDLVTRSISGHATETMQRHYSTVALDEQRRGLASVIQLLEPQTLLPKPGTPSSVGRKVGRVLPEVGRIEHEAGIAG